MAIDETKLEAFMGSFVNDLGALMHAATIVVGDKLGLYKTLASAPMSAEQAFALAEEGSPAFIPDAFEIAVGATLPKSHGPAKHAIFH